MDNQQLLQLLEKHQTGNCSEDELQQLDKWYRELLAGKTAFLQEDSATTRQQLADDMLQHFRQYTLQKQALVRKISGTRRIIFRAAAAVIFVLLTATAYYFLLQKPNGPAAQQNNIVQNTDILPGGNKALLLLANGDTIELSSAANGQLAQQGTSEIEKTKDGLIVYNTTGAAEQNLSAVINTIHTPRGGQYQVVLSDGTHVWLNAASTLKYPAVFSGNERRVELTGEAYFEVAGAPLGPSSGGGGKSKLPFIVSVSSSPAEGKAAEVEVLGTHFNINSYADETAIRTTLLEGKVKLSATGSYKGRNESAILQPGQQAQLINKEISVINNANIEEAIAWKNGLFTYSNADIQTIMRQAARWYDLEVVYEGAVTAERFRGKIERDAKLSEFLKILALNNVQFETEGNKITVKPNQ